MGVKVGLIIGLYLVVLYLYMRYKKENYLSVFKDCKNNKRVYIYWTRNSVASKRPVPIYINRKVVGFCKKGEILELKRMKETFELTSVSEVNQNKVVVENDSELVFIIIDSNGKCERYFSE